MIQWVQGVWFLIILRAFYIKMSRVASRIYALLSVIRQQMSPFDPFRGGVAQRGHVPFFYRFFYLEASLRDVARTKKRENVGKIPTLLSSQSWPCLESVRDWLLGKVGIFPTFSRFLF